MKRIAALALAASLSACAGQALDTQDDVEALTRFVAADIRAALADAKIHEDQSAVQCWTVLLAKVEDLPRLTASPVVGAASAFQKARNARRRFDAGVSEEVHIACAAMLDDARSTILRLGRLISGI